ncbi:MAG: hypothetical protein EBR30_01690 [Cytophagia bacterium]|nr:hypothetical protein [Cytophagia bacterium]
MTISELLENYSYATEAVREWFMTKMMESFNDESVPADFKEFMRKQGVPNDRIVKLVQDNARVFFDAFDDNGVIINIVCTENGFSWNVGDVKSVQFYKNRKDAEQAAVERAFIILDEKLNILISETTNNEGPDSTAGGE